MKRMAGQVVAEPGFWERLGDNEYTRGWSRLVSDVLRPADRMLASDQELRAALAVPFGEAYGAMQRTGDGAALAAQLGVLDPRGQLALQRRVNEKGPQAVAALMERAAAEGDQLSVEEAAEALFRDSLAAQVGRQELQMGMKRFGPALPVTGAGQVVHAAMGNPVAAYGTAAAGLGLGGWGAYALAQQLEQQERQSSQLPMS